MLKIFIKSKNNGNKTMSEIERKIFVFVGILEKEDSDASHKETHYSTAISQLTFRVLNTNTWPFTFK